MLAYAAAPTLLALAAQSLVPAYAAAPTLLAITAYSLVFACAAAPTLLAITAASLVFAYTAAPTLLALAALSVVLAHAAASTLFGHGVRRVPIFQEWLGIRHPECPSALLVHLDGLPFPLISKLVHNVVLRYVALECCSPVFCGAFSPPVITQNAECLFDSVRRVC